MDDDVLCFDGITTVQAFKPILYSFALRVRFCRMQLPALRLKVCFFRELCDLRTVRYLRTHVHYKALKIEVISSLSLQLLADVNQSLRSPKLTVPCKLCTLC